MNKNFIEVGVRIKKLSLLRRIELNKICAEAGLYPGQIHILEFIRIKNGCTQKEIADALGVTPASIATSTKRLQKAGLVEKQADKDNLRNNMLSVTEKGLVLAEKCHEGFDQLDNKLYSGFSEEDLTKLKGYLDRLIYNISEGKDVGLDFFTMAALRNKAENQHQGVNK